VSLLLLLVLLSLFCNQAVMALSPSSPLSSSSSTPHASFSAFAFVSSASSFFPIRARQAPQQHLAQGRQRRSASLQMRDASMTRDFTVGDVVRIEKGVELDGMDWSGLVGTVTTTWVK